MRGNQGKDNMTDHDLLICIDIKLKELKQQFANHIKHHWMVTIPMIGITFGSIVSLIITLLTK